MTLDDLYHRAWRSGPNVGEHCPTLRLLAMECRHVVEFGVNGGVSTTALLAGQPDRLTSYDVRVCPSVEPLRAVAGHTQFEFVQADSLTIGIAPCDLLMIDSHHTFVQLSAELERHCHQVNFWIVLHDTVTFGDTGEDGGRGLGAAIGEFLARHHEWTLAVEYRNSHGLTILRRRGRDRTRGARAARSAPATSPASPASTG